MVDTSKSCVITSCLIGTGICCCITLFVLALALIIDCVQTVKYDEYGLSYNIYTQYVRDKVYTPGRYFLTVGQRFLRFPKIYTTIEFSNTPEGTAEALKSRTFDGLSITLEISFQYRLKQEDIKAIFDMFGTEYHSIYVKIARDVLRDVASKYNSTQFFDQRREIAAEMLEELRSHMSEVKATVDFLQLRQVDLPDAYENIIEQKEMVRQEIQKAEYEKEAKRVSAETEVMVSEKLADVKLVEATAAAKAIVLQAEAHANGTKTRINAESEAYKNLKDELGFTPNELLSYLWIQAVRDHDSNRLIVNLDKPAILLTG